MNNLLSGADYPRLNLPDAPLRLRASSAGGRPEVWDALRGKWLKLTPEEWVRRHVIHFLVTERGAAAERIVQEDRLSLNGVSLRADVVVYDRLARPLLLVECKAPSVPISQDTLNQIACYNLSLGVPLLMVTNGLNHLCFEVDRAAGRVSPIDRLPML